LVYQFIELPLYNAWLAVHWILSITGYATPLPEEISKPLYMLGVGYQDNWNLLQSELNDLRGGMTDTPLFLSEGSGVDRQETYPLDVVTDPRSSMPGISNTISSLFDNGEGISEFTRPWQWPQYDNEGHSIPTEYPRIVIASPYRSGQDAYALMADAPGDQAFRENLEKSRSALETINVVDSGLHANTLLGDPSDYSAYIIAKLTRDNPGTIANFNLDADRGYGFLCWDWLRFKNYWGAPSAYQDSTKSINSTHKYNVPYQAGSGWDMKDVLENPPQPLPVMPPMEIQYPTEHHPYDKDNFLRPVKIRYIDREEKYYHEA
jgi:hypothetical protein